MKEMTEKASLALVQLPLVAIARPNRRKLMAAKASPHAQYRIVASYSARSYHCHQMTAR
jgi:hypothetical protein